MFFAFAAKKITTQGGQQRHQTISSCFVVYAFFVCRVVLNTSPQFHSLNLRVAQNISRICHTQKIEQQIGREIAARRNHSSRKRRNFRCSSDRLVQLRHCVGVAVELKRRAVRCAEKAVSHVQRVIQSDSPLVHGAKKGQKHCNLNCACSVKPAITPQGKTQAALEIVDRYCSRSSLAFGRQSFHLLS